MMLIKDLRIAPMRTFLTGFSMFIGIIAVILSVLVGTIGQSYLTAANEQLYGRKPTFSVQVTEGNFTDYSHMNAMINRFEKTIPNCGIVFTPAKTIFFSSGNSYVEKKYLVNELLTKAVSFDTVFTTSGYNRVFNLPMTSGRWFEKDGFERQEVVINKAALGVLGDVNIMYASIKESLNLSPMAVVGVVNDGRDEPRVYVNSSAFAYYNKQLWSSNSAVIYVRDVDGLGKKILKSVVSDGLYDTTGGHVGDISLSSAASGYSDVGSALQVGIAVTAILLLFVSAVGLLNIGLATLEQRTHELLIRRALGATRGSVAGLVLGGAIVLAVLVSILAIVISVGIVAMVQYFLPYDTPVSAPGYPVMAAVIAVLAALVTALVGSIIPAVRASRLQPALVLR